MPASKPYRFHPAAWEEFEAADDWYAERSPDASLGFLSAIADALDNIRSAPRRWPPYLFRTRRFVLQRFPFSVIYLDDPDRSVLSPWPTPRESRDTGGGGCRWHAAPNSRRFEGVSNREMSTTQTYPWVVQRSQRCDMSAIIEVDRRRPVPSSSSAEYRGFCFWGVWRGTLAHEKAMP